MFLLIILPILALLYYFISKYIQEKRSLWKRKGVIHDPTQSIWKALNEMRKKPMVDVIQDHYNQYPDERYYGQFLFMHPLLNIKDPDLTKQIMVKDFDHFVDRRQVVSAEVDPLWGRSLIALEGERWHNIRSTLTPAFTGSKMRIIFKLVEETAKQFVQHYKNLGENNFEVEMKDVASRFSNDVIATAAFGLKVDSFQNPNNEFFAFGKDATNFSGLRMARFLVSSFSPTLSKFLKIRAIPSYICEYFSKIIVDTLKVREEQNITRPDMLHLMKEAMKENNTENSQKEPIAIEDIISQAFVFLLGGFDTISSALSFACYEIALQPEIQSKLTKEIDSTDIDTLNYETLQNLPYLDMVISEALRKWPPSVITERLVTKPYTIEPTKPDEKPLELEPGLTIAFPIMCIHRDPKYFPDPDKFDPERFNSENKQKIHPYAYMPFGFGPRHCIGVRLALLELKLFVFYFLRHFEISPVARTKIPMVLAKNTVNLIADGGMYLGVKARN